MANIPSGIRLVFIDIDNTLLDFAAYVKETLRTGFKHFGIAEYQPYMYGVFKEINDGLWRDIENNTLTFDQLQKIRFNRIFAALGVSFDGPTFETYFRQALNESGIPMPGAMALLDALDGKYILATASNGPYHQQMNRLRIAGMERYFTYFCISEKLGASKPDRAFFDAAFLEINAGREEPIKPSECLIIGDSATADMAGAIEYGIHTCFYHRHPDEPVPRGVELSSDSLGTIAGWFRE